MIASRLCLAGTIATTLLALALPARAIDNAAWNFDDEDTGVLPRGFVSAVGRWRVVETNRGKVLAQLERSPKSVFNVILVEKRQARDLDLSVKLRPIAGENDQGGGLIWRARDPKNYYIARFNPLEENFRVYTVVDGKRTQLQSAKVTHSPDWCRLRVTMKGDHIICYLDGALLLDVHDTTFPEAGKIGLWSKSDAQTEFDELELRDF
jgi:hypothetical protein